MELNKRIRKVILETQERKQKLLIEEKIINDRLNMIFNGISSIEDFNNLSEDKKFRLSYSLVKELNFLQNNGLIKEQVNFGSILQSLFGSNVLGSATETLLEPFVKKILSYIGLGKGPIGNFIVSFITSRPSELIAAFNDCKIMVKLIAESMTEAMVMTLQEKFGANSHLFNFMRNTLGGVTKDTEFIKSLERQLQEPVCNMINNFSSNGLEVLKKLKS